MYRVLGSLFLALFAFCGDRSSPPNTRTGKRPVSGVEVTVKQNECAGRPRVTSNGILLPDVLKRVEPDVSKCAGRLASGNPVIEAVIDHSGKVASVRVVSDPNSCAAQAAAAAVKQWRFCPAERDGEFIEATMQFTVHINYR